MAFLPAIPFLAGGGGAAAGAAAGGVATAAATAAAVGAGVYGGAKLLKAGVKAITPKVPQPPGAPQIDEAALAIQASDRLRRRRGAMANIYAGNAAAPTVGKSTLGG